MGRHRSTLRDLGWGVSNSPNPWKQGTAKRVVRTLDYGGIEVEEPPLPEAPHQLTRSVANVHHGIPDGSRLCVTARAVNPCRGAPS